MSRFGAVPGGDLTILRSGAGVVFDYLTIAPPLQVLTTQIDGPLVEADFPRGHLDIDNVAGTLSDVKPGMEVWIGTAAGLSDVWVGRVRKAPAAGTLYIAELGHGDPGLARPTHLRAADDHYVTVIEPMGLWYAFPRILVSGGTGTVYQDWDLAYSDQNEYPPPVAVIEFTINGLTYQHAAAFVDPDDDLLTVEADAGNSFAVTPGTGIAGWQWVLPAAATIVSGTLTSQSLVFTVPAGAYWVQCTATDDNGKTGVARRFLRAHTRTGAEAPTRILSYSAHRDRRGMTASFQIPANDAGLAAIPHGAFALLWAELEFGGQACDSTAHTFAGWCVREDTGHGAAFPTVALEVAGPGALLEQVPASPWSLEVATSPAAWYEVRSGLNNVPGVTWWLLRWGANLTTLFDLRLLKNTGEAWSDTRQEGFGGEALGAPTLGGQLAGVAAAIRANFGSASDGTLVLERNPCYLDDRAGWPARIVLEAGDVDAAGVAANGREHRLRVGSVRADAFAYLGGQSIPLRSIAPDWTPAQAPGSEDLQNMIALSQADLNALSGHHFAYANNPLQDIDVPLARMLDVVEPVDMAFVGLKVTAAQFADPVHGRAWQRLFGLAADPGEDRTLNLLAQSVMLDREMGTTVRRVRLRCEGETRGDPGRTVPIEQAGTAAEPSSVAISGVTGPRPPDAVFVDASQDAETPLTDADPVYAFVEVPGSPVTFKVLKPAGFASGTPVWADVGTVGAGKNGNEYIDCLLDPADGNKAWFVNYDRLFDCTDLGDDPQTWTAKSDLDEYGQIDLKLVASAYRANWLAYGRFRYESPVFRWNEFLYSTDRGANWTTVVVHRPNYQAAPPDPICVGLDVDPFGQGKLYQAVLDEDGATNLYRVAVASGWGEEAGDWTVLDTAVGDTVYASDILIPKLLPSGSLNSAGAFALASCTSGLLKTLNSFSTVTEIYATAGARLAAHPLDSDYLALGDYLSSSGAASWTEAPGSGCDFWPYARKTVIARGDATLKLSTDFGATWADREGNITALVGAGWTCRKVLVTKA